MALDLLFAIRGLLSFVAFTEFTTAGRCLLPYEAQGQAQGLPQDNLEGSGNAVVTSYVQGRLFTGDLLDCVKVSMRYAPPFSFSTFSSFLSILSI